MERRSDENAVGEPGVGKAQSRGPWVGAVVRDGAAERAGAR